MTRSTYPASDLGFGYDSRSNLKTVTNHLDSSKSKSFTYDSLNRLKTFAGAWGSGSYQYQSSGNRSQKVVDSETTNYSYVNSRLNSQTGRNYGYNTDGDMTQSGDLNFDYDPFHQITQVRKNSNVIATYGYDGNKQRVLKTADNETTFYFYDFAGNVLSETREDGTPLVDYVYLNSKLISKVTHNRAGDIYRDGEITLKDTILGLQTVLNQPSSFPLSLASDVNQDSKIGLAEIVHSLNVLANPSPTENELFFYDLDSLGTPVALSDTSGNILWQVDELPFGEEYQSEGNTALNKRRFIGKEKDTETGLLYFGARYMDDGSGRFTSPDPVGLVDIASGKINQEILHDPQRLNRYAYGLNNPYRYVDPDGNAPIETDEILTIRKDAREVAARSIQRSKQFVDFAAAVGSAGIASGMVTRSTGKGIGILRSASKGKGNFGLGSGTRSEANKLGKAWVGKGYGTASDGKTLISKDKLRQYRPPSYKPRLNKTQANFEQRFSGQKSKRWQSNGHMDIKE